MWENCWYYLLHAIIKTRFYLRLAMNQDRSTIHELQRIQQQTGKDQNDQQPEKPPNKWLITLNGVAPTTLVTSSPARINTPIIKIKPAI